MQLNRINLMKKILKLQKSKKFLRNVLRPLLGCHQPTRTNLTKTLWVKRTMSLQLVQKERMKTLETLPISMILMTKTVMNGLTNQRYLNPRKKSPRELMMRSLTTKETITCSSTTFLRMRTQSRWCSKKSTSTSESLNANFLKRKTQTLNSSCSSDLVKQMMVSSYNSSKRSPTYSNSGQYHLAKMWLSHLSKMRSRLRIRQRSNCSWRNLFLKDSQRPSRHTLEDFSMW